MSKFYGKVDKFEGDFIAIWSCSYCKYEVLPDVIEAMDKSTGSRKQEINWSEHEDGKLYPLCPNSLIIYDNIQGYPVTRTKKCNNELLLDLRE